MEDAVTAISQTRCELFVDAIFGTGLRRPVVGEIADVIEGINRLPVPVIAVDLPSGLDADTGQPLSACVRADKTVTIGFPKRGLLLHPGAEFAGKLEVADIGFPKQVVAAQNIGVNWTTARGAADWLPPRPRASHKGSYGRVLVVAGSTGMTGAAALASEAALRIGAGLVTLAIPKSLNPILEVKLSEVMTLPLPETEAGSLAESAAEPILKFVEKTKSVMAIGPGLSQQPETVSLVHKLVQAKSAFGRVIDADGLNALAQTIISHDADVAGDRPPPYSSKTSRDNVAGDRPPPYGSKTSRDDVAGDRPTPDASGTVARGPVPRALSNTNTVLHTSPRRDGTFNRETYICNRGRPDWHGAAICTGMGCDAFA